MTTINNINGSSENCGLASGIAELKTTKRKKPRATTALAEKLRAIRLWKKLSQTEILLIVAPDVDPAHRALISQWENQSREPSRRTLIRYARFAEISLEELLIDERELPAHIIAGAERSSEEEAEANASNHLNFHSPNDENLHSIPDSDELSESETETSPTETDETNSAECFELPFISSDKESEEEITLRFPTKLLDQLDDARLQLLALLPRPARPLLTTENIIGFSVKLLIYQNSQPIEEPLLVAQAKALGEWWAHNNRDLSDSSSDVLRSVT